jgi:hypothetical protein
MDMNLLSSRSTLAANHGSTDIPNDDRHFLETDTSIAIYKSCVAHYEKPTTGHGEAIAHGRSGLPF